MPSAAPWTRCRAGLDGRDGVGERQTSVAVAVPVDTDLLLDPEPLEDVLDELHDVERSVRDRCGPTVSQTQTRFAPSSTACA